MVRTIPHRELRNDSSRILAEVEAGETIQVTNHGRVVAVLSPPPPAPGAALGFRPARSRAPFSEIETVTRDHPIQESLDFLRGDR